MKMKFGAYFGLLYDDVPDGYLQWVYDKKAYNGDEELREYIIEHADVIGIILRDEDKRQ